MSGGALGGLLDAIDGLQIETELDPARLRWPLPYETGDLLGSAESWSRKRLVGVV